ncbi:hypothetical protein Taro_025386 [Colocasia esculenta]|uniref:Uncharacterized protein n=1 Tax=Colocasia esculenta TaxID=4460 RepID=A0A843VN74_COLES|nr:hypothetical protein [Colocasia esculenta]
MLAGLFVEVAVSIVSVAEAVVVVMVVVAVAPPFPIIDSDLEGDLMWWQCQQPPCLLRSEVVSPPPHLLGQARLEVALFSVGSMTGITPKKYRDSTTGGKSPNLVEEEVDREKEIAISLLLPFCDQDRDKGETVVFFFLLLILLRSGQGQGANGLLLLLLLIGQKIGAAAAGPLPPPFLRPAGEENRAAGPPSSFASALRTGKRGVEVLPFLLFFC